MKYSGVEWIGNIPDNHSLIKAKYLLRFEKGKLPSEINSDGIGLPYIGASEMNGATPKDYTTSNVPTCNSEDILILWDGANAGLVSSGHCGAVSSTVTRARNNSDYNSRFLYYTFKAAEAFYRDKVNGTTIPHMSTKYLDDTFILQFSKEKQIQIASFLDERCSAIDEAIQKVNQSIDEYKKIKQAIIYFIATNGLTPSNNYIDSGIVWAAKIPANWSVKPFKFILAERNEKNSPIVSTERLSLSIDQGVTLYAEKTTNLDRFKDDFSQYKLAHKGDLVLNSMNMIVGAVGVSNYFGCVSPAYYTFFDDTQDHITTRYYNYLFHTKALMRVLYSIGKGIYAIERGDDRVNTCRLKVSREDLRSMKFPVPPISEQKKIVSFLDQKCASIDNIVSMKQTELKKLESLKKTLIYEYVTGKKEVE